MLNFAVACETGNQLGDGTPALASECLVPVPLYESRYGSSLSKPIRYGVFSKVMILTVLSPFELGASTSTYPPDICKPKLLSSPFYYHVLIMGSCFLFNENDHSTPYLCYLSSSLHMRLHRYLSSLANSGILTSHSCFHGHSASAVYFLLLFGSHRPSFTLRFRFRTYRCTCLHLPSMN